MLPHRTERLLLRTFEEGDLEALYDMHSREEVHRYLYGEPLDMEGAAARLERKIANRRIEKRGDTLAVAVVLPSNGSLIGDLTLTYVSEVHQQAEIGFIIHPDHHGKGYASEASRYLLHIAFNHLNVHRVMGQLEARNAASARVLQKLGMRREGLLVENEFVKGEWQSELVYAILEREWRRERPGSMQMHDGFDVPTLVSEDLRLRPFRGDDQVLIEEAAQDPYIPKTTSVPAVPSTSASQAYIERQWEKARKRQAYPFVIERPHGTAVGFIGLFLRDIAEGRASLGYWVVPSARGLATSSLALKEVTRWALGELHIPRLELYIEPWNQASIASAEKAGFAREALLKDHDVIDAKTVDIHLYSLEAPTPFPNVGAAPKIARGRHRPV